PEIVRAAERALKSARHRRYQDMGAMAADLRRIRMRITAVEDAPIVHGSSDTTIDIPQAIPHTPRAYEPAPIRRGSDREELAKRRASQIAAHLNAAQQAFASGQYELGIAACEDVLMLDPAHEEALELLERAKTAVDER